MYIYVEITLPIFYNEYKYFVRCKVDGWGFPSTGLSEVINFCQANKKWNFTNVEECICKCLYIFRN